MNEDEIKNLIKEEVREYFRQSFPGFEMVANNETLGHGIGEFCLTTDSAQGIHFYKQGNCKLNANKSFEVYSGSDATDKDLSIGFYSINGNIHLKAPNGDLILEGKNVKIQATGTDGSVSSVAPKVVYSRAPESITEVDKFRVTAANEAEMIGGFCSVHSEAGPVEVSGGDDEILNQDFISQIINIIDKVKKFFTSVCG